MKTEAGRATAGGSFAAAPATISRLSRRPAETPGGDKQPESFEAAGKTANDQGAERDTLVAPARACMNALNKFPVMREQTAPTVMSA